MLKLQDSNGLEIQLGNIVSKAGANEAGAYRYFTDGSGIKFVVSKNQTYVETSRGEVIILDGRVGI
jgi:hypothetical protein